MSWRRHETHREETKAVRTALKAAGINARVGHGSGTAWGWLEINIGAGQQWGDHQRVPGQEWCDTDCTRCANLRAMRERALKIAQKVTGRRGDYHGQIQVLSQDHWNKSRGEREEIAHPKWKQCAA